MSDHRVMRFRPAELLIMSAILTVFTSLVVLLVTRQALLMILFGGAVFVVSFLLLALLGFVMGADADGDEGGHPDH